MEFSPIARGAIANYTAAVGALELSCVAPAAIAVDPYATSVASVDAVHAVAVAAGSIDSCTVGTGANYP